MTKFNVLVSYVCETETELEAIFALNKSLRPLSENELLPLLFHLDHEC